MNTSTHTFAFIAAALASLLCVCIWNCVQGEFADDSTETHFAVGKHECSIKATGSGKKGNGVIHTLLVDGTKVM